MHTAKEVPHGLKCISSGFFGFSHRRINKKLIERQKDGEKIAWKMHAQYFSALRILVAGI